MSARRSEDHDLVESGRGRLAAAAEAIHLVGQTLDERFVSAVRLIREAPGKVITVGVGTSGPVARRMAHLLSTSGTPSLFLHPGDALHGGLGAVTTGDVVLAVSKGGGSAELNAFIELAKRRGAAILVLTAQEESPLASQADVVAVLPQRDDSDPGGIIAMGSSLAAAAWGDALAIVLMQISGYGWSEVIGAHPSGAVGQKRGLPDPLPALPDPARGEAR